MEINVKTRINMKLTGKNIKRLFKLEGPSIKLLMEYLELESENAIYKWFRGETKPSTENLLLLSKLWNIEIKDILITYEEAMEKPLKY